MGWKPLKVVALKKRREKLLQDVFDGWDASRPATAGAPKWLREMTCPQTPKKQRRFKAYGYEYIPDVLWSDGKRSWVVELKCSYKYEPLAMAEVLHHAHMLATHELPKTEVVPVVVSSYSPWLRGAAAWLGKAGTVGLQTLEVDVLEDGDLLWFDAPLAPWRRALPPPRVPKAYSGGRFEWFRVAETGTWIGAQSRHRTRPLVISEPYVMVAPVHLKGDRSEQYVMWQGQPPQRLSRHSSKNWARSEYWLWTPGVANIEPKPIV